ncbi:hypothetical protein [Gemmobacter nectariphilus]|uniref:hypothetical protein n=1 Tax=Gemmobacter nectariphilus TaxID=220343 RepID=UPI0003FD68C9|nr:hypothetical protein [Gemmobacter nectariphilus]
MAAPRPFWMVKGAGPTNAIHATRMDAEREADRLAKQNPGVNFYVLQAIACHRKIEVERVSLIEATLDMDDEEIPF